MKVFFYQAECGDAARINFIDAEGQPRNILIDSGYERTFRHILKEEIINLKSKKEKIDLCVVSHIHDDHIGGILKYIKTIKSGELEDLIDKWFYNPPREYFIPNPEVIDKTISSPMSIGQGDDLFHYIYSNGKSLGYDITNELKQINFHNLEMTILSPSKEKLKDLRGKYKSEYTKLERIENDSISQASSSRGFDYQTKIEDFDQAVLKDDNSVENGSSIAFLTEHENSKVLWLADSHPNDIIESLKDLGYSKENKLVCDWVKVSHHGSVGNNSSELYEMIECSNYLLSVNGENIHNLPAKESLARIILNRNRDLKKKYSFHFTYDNSTLRDIFRIDGEGVFSKWNFEVFYLTEGKYLEITF